MWKGNILEDLESEKVKFELAEKFLLVLKKEFGGGDEQLVKVIELQRIEQERIYARVSKGSKR